uniref:F-box domain-containing protein n=1 Tax=Anopheles darlingi TaxID=43151 RepID=A0A2M4D0K2_ANODA
MATDCDDDPPYRSEMKFLDLPDCMIEQVLEFLPYDEIAKKRIVCRTMDRICQSLLNRGFNKMVRRHNQHLKTIKSQLPRRESERRNHPLAKHSDILTCIETRISMLSMTYAKYIDKDLCCFIPGKVIDEVLTILRLIENTTRPLRAHEILQELRDISSMAIEHFDENIAHRLKKYVDVPFPHHHHHPVAGIQGPSTNPFPSTMLLHNDVLIPCELIPNLPQSTATTPPAPRPLPSSSSTVNARVANHGFYRPTCAAGRFNHSLLARMDKKAQRMRNDITHINRTLANYRVETRSMRLMLKRMLTEMKELRRRLEESETKNRELLANIHQISFGAPSAATAAAAAVVSPPATIKQCGIKARQSAILKRVLPVSETDSHTQGPVSSVPLSLGTPTALDVESPPDAMTMGGTTAKKAKLSD